MFYSDLLLKTRSVFTHLFQTGPGLEHEINSFEQNLFAKCRLYHILALHLFLINVLLVALGLTVEKVAVYLIYYFFYSIFSVFPRLFVTILRLQNK